MPDQNQTTPTTKTPTPPPVDDTVAPVETTVEAPVDAPIDTPVETTDEAPAEIAAPQNNLDVMANVSEKIKGVHNILVALSSDPSVDEIAAAIGLSLCLDRAGKRATAIYSGKTPNALEFLKPENTFETNSDVLRDFVIALSKDKADHLRYKLDGDFVKIFITPYKSRIDEDDLEFSYGDFNIELVLALDVMSGIDLDDALREHGRVMHDAVVVNITNGNPGKFGDIEWSDKTKSSVSEMVADLLFSIGGEKALEGDEATALLTGIVASTEHFSNNMTTAASLQMAARLIESGANRELISENIGLDTQNMFFSSPTSSSDEESSEEKDSSLDIEHDPEEEAKFKKESESDSEKSESSDEKSDDKKDTKEDSSKTDKEKSTKEDKSKDSTLLADLQAAADSLSHAGAEVTPESTDGPLAIDSKESDSPASDENKDTSEPTESIKAVESTTSPADTPESVAASESATFTAEAKQEKTITPSEEFTSETSDNKYGKMLEEALAEATASVPPAPVAEQPADMPAVTPISEPTQVLSFSNPAIAAAPPVASQPEINGVPEINYMPTPDGSILPPPPTPPIDFSSPAPMNAPEMTPAPAPVGNSDVLGNNPVVVAPDTKPGSYQIPTANS